MITIAQTLEWTLVVIGVLFIYDVLQQSRDVFGMLRYLRREMKNAAHPTSEEEVTLPRAAIVLALRGPDPQLSSTLDALLVQEYDDFYVHVVVDSEQDPVLEDVYAVKRTSGGDRIHVSVLKDPARTCSLKCSSLIQAMNDLRSGVEIVAFIDGDAVPHATWLKELAVPLVKGEADVVGGNRWYFPPSAQAGTMARYFWNAAYMTGMWAQGAPWAGTMAFYRETADRIGLLQAWRTAMSVDATLHRCLTEHGLKFKFVHSLIMSNREDISVPEFHRWVTRQMAVIRYSASKTARSAEIQVGILLVLHALLPAAAITALCVSLPMHALAAVAMLLGYWTICGCRMTLIERTVRATVAARGEETNWVGLGNIFMWFPSVAVTHYVIGFGVLKALQVKTVDWRGVSYQLASNGSVQMCDYRPYGAKWVRTDNHSVV